MSESSEEGPNNKDKQSDGRVAREKAQKNTSEAGKTKQSFIGRKKKEAETKKNKQAEEIICIDGGWDGIKVDGSMDGTHIQSKTLQDSESRRLLIPHFNNTF